ncbi:non-specific serine/threonine protein kinase [Parastagonospora nodorum]|nr:non-specific serine/threonine protein kinase [Parastagonospora nodorum]KAH4049136.1 non-specific serine/threonine protein kinase [Parastagonospora nodorum]KAH4260211.1 non-specific serine/threonine protein kinase [Parastagonospora nodorum]KAH5056450.1 non-specific serine/threonine protein kinase [Parastagonospora nodorum]KAH5139742.1 non-specific serine/threonine protein kinase [Parastagonospora nodorum]
MTEPTPVPPIEPPPAPDTSLPLHTPPPPFSAQNLAQITQGAEALVYKSTFLTPHTPCVVKYRPPKPYRHPTLDKRLTKARLLAEARSLVRCRKEGVRVPGILALGAEEGWIVMDNLMLAPPSTTSDDQDEWSLQGDVYLIDFGLTTASIQDEDKAVDLYVLERAFAATHPAAEPLFQEVLRAYGESYGGARGVLKRLEGVRGRGRKRSMLG